MNNCWLPGDYYNFKFAVVGKKFLFIPYRDAMVNSLNKYGIIAQGFEEIDQAIEFHPQVIVVINPILFTPPKKHGKKIIFVAIQTEQLHTEFGGEIFGKTHIKQLKPYLNSFDIILDWSKDHIEVLKKITKNEVLYFPHSYFSELEVNMDTSKNNNNPKYDIIFIGNMPGVDERRKKAIEYLSSIYNVHPIRNDLWGEKKKIALMDSKICLNIHYEESRCMESPRIYDYFANHCFVLSEPMHSTFPFVEGKDYVEFFWTNIKETIDYYLEHPEIRQRISDHAYSTLKSVDMVDTIKILIEQIIVLRYRKKLR